MASVQNIRDLVSNYISGSISAADFANSFTPVLGDAVASKEESVKDLALAVHAEISQFFNGLSSENEMRLRLAPIGDVARVPALALISVQHMESFKSEQLLSSPRPTPFAELVCV